MPLVLRDRFHPQLRHKEQAAIDAGRLQIRDEMALLDMQQLRPLALLSLYMFVGGGLFFASLNFAAYYWHYQTLSVSMSVWDVVIWCCINILSYIIILPIHEVLHALAFLLWGGKPSFGMKLPLALYCEAKGQIFHRDHYLVVGLAPLVVITLAGIILTLYAPILASYLFLATIGNFSGAAGDVWVTARLLRQNKDLLIEDTGTGYRAWEIES